MTEDEATEAGRLVKARREIAVALDDLADQVRGDPAELIGVSLSHDHCDAGSSGVGPDVIVSPGMARSTMEFLRDLIAGRLAELGVTPQ